MATPDKSIGRVFVEAGVDLTQLNKGFDQIVKTITDTDGKIAASMKRTVTSFEAAYNPTLKLGATLETLALKGKTAGELIAVFGDKVKAAMEKAAQTGAEPSKIVANLDAQMKVMTKDTEASGSAIQRFGQVLTDFARNPLQATQAGITSLLTMMGPLAVGIAGVATAIGVAAYQFGKFVFSIVDEVEALENLSAQTGISTQRLQALHQMQREAGLGGMDLSRVIAQLNSQMGKGEGEFVKTLKAMGIALKDSNGEMRDSFDVLSEFGDAIKGIVNPTEQVQVAMAALGPRAREFVAFLSRMQGSMKDVADQMQKEGIGFGENAKKNANDLDEVLDRLSRKWEAYKTTIKSLALMTPMLANTFLVLKAVAGEAAKAPDLQMGPPLPPGYYQERIKAQEELDKKQKQSQSEALAAQKKIADAITAQMEYQIRLNDETKVYGALVEAAAKIWEKQNKELTVTEEHLQAMMDWGKQWTSLFELHPIELFPKNAEGKTPEEQMKDVSGAVNQTIPEVLTSWEKGGESMAETWRRQVSTIVTDWSRGIADIILSGQNFGEKLKAIFLDTAKGILRMMIEQLFKPLQNWLSGILNSLFGMGKSGAGGTASAGGLAAFGGIAGMSASVIGGGLMAGLTIPQTATGKMLGGIAGGVGGVAAAGAIAGGAAGSGIGAGAMSFLGMIGPWGLAALGAAAVGLILYKAFTKNTFEAGAIEAARDLGGLNIGEKAIKAFITGLGLTGKQAEPIRKDLLASPLFISQVAVPAAQEQGKLEPFLKSLEKVTVDTKIAASGYLNFRAVVEQGIKTGNWDAFNKAYEAAFKNSKALMAVMPDFASRLAAVATAVDEVVAAVDVASQGFQSLRDAIVASLPAAKDMFQVFWDTGEILPELASLIEKYGGNLETFQKAAGLGKIRADLASIGDLMAGLNDILPEEGIIQRILGGKGFGATGWGDLAAMGLDPSKLLKMADLATFQQGWEPARSGFEQTGKLTKGGVLEQSLWQFGGGAGATALSRYDQGFNTITPALLDSVKTGMDAAYQAERASVMEYLSGIQSTMESEIQSASDAIIAELDLILKAIQAGQATTPADSADNPAAAIAEQGGTYIDMRGATVYGYEDFESKIQSAWMTGYRRGAYDSALG